MAPHAVVLSAAQLKVPWAQTPMYNTLMSVAAGIGLLLLVALGRELYLRRPILAEGWAAAFGVLGLLLTITGAHMSLTWPLSSIAPFDNIIFGETSLAFGVLLLASAVYLWRRGHLITEVTTDAQGRVANPVRTIARAAWPISIFVAGIGLGLFGIAAAGVRYQLFAAPPQEPISGAFADYPIVEAIFMSGLIALVGLGAVLFPFAVRALATPDRGRTVLVPVIGWVWGIAGVVLGLFGALNYFTHIGLIINTM